MSDQKSPVWVWGCGWLAGLAASLLVIALISGQPGWSSRPLFLVLYGVTPLICSALCIIGGYLWAVREESLNKNQRSVYALTITWTLLLGFMVVMGAYEVYAGVNGTGIVIGTVLRLALVLPLLYFNLFFLYILNRFSGRESSRIPLDDDILDAKF